MPISKKDRKYILKNYPAVSIKDLARELGVRPQEVREVIESSGQAVKDRDKEGLPAPRKSLLGYTPARALGVMVLVALVSVVFLNSMRNGFHYDDIHSLLQNFGVQVEWTKNPESRTLFYRYFYQPELFSSRPKVGMPRPLLMETFALNYLAGTIACDSFHNGCKDRGYDPRGWLLFNILLHLINTIIIYVGLCHLTGRHRIALLTAILFAVHPINTESVNYINCRSESFGVLWMLLSIYFFMRSLQTDGRRPLVLSAVFLALGLLTKEMSFVTPALVFWAGFIFVHAHEREDESFIINMLANMRNYLARHFRKFAVLIAVDVAYLIYRSAVMESMVGRPPRSYGDNFATQIPVLVSYLRLLFVPVHQNISYENIIYRFKDVVHDPLIFGGLTLLAGLAGLGLAWYKKHPVVSFAIANFFVTLSITSIMPLNAIKNEHRLYLPSLGACLLIVGLMDQSAAYFTKKDGPRGAWPAPAQALAVAVIIFFVSLTAVRNLSWHTDLTVWRDSVRNSPTKAQVVSDLGNAYYRSARAVAEGGEITKDGKIDKADSLIISQTFRQSVPEGPITPEVRKTLDELSLKGLNRAELLYLWGIRVERSYYKAWHNLGTINYTYARADMMSRDNEAAKRHLGMAVEFFKGAAQIYPNGESYNDLASTLMMLLRLETDPKKQDEILKQADKFYEKAVIYNPELPKGFINLARIKEQQGDIKAQHGDKGVQGKYDEAIQLLDKAIQLNPVDPFPYTVKAQIQLKLEKPGAAADTYKACLQASPGYGPCLDGLQKIQQGGDFSPGTPAPEPP
ncbi:MAG TPA: glycosyltransferase family 39 protein [bacterium]|nr:glycosyltransferase family 39 protein [bacterium]